MGCLPSRTTTVSPVDSASSSSDRAQRGRNVKSMVNGSMKEQSEFNKNAQDETQKDDASIKVGKDNLSGSSQDGHDDDIMSILMADDRGDKSKSEKTDERRESKVTAMDEAVKLSIAGSDGKPQDDEGQMTSPSGDIQAVSNQQENSRENSFDEELNMDLLRQYIVVDYEITQLEDRDALRIYHEKIEQLEQLERELDMITTEAEEVVARNDLDSSANDRLQSANGSSSSPVELKADNENNSIISEVTNSLSAKSSVRTAETQKGGQKQKTRLNNQNQPTKIQKNQIFDDGSRKASTLLSSKLRANRDLSVDNLQISNRIIASNYTTMEDVFNRKIILEKERDKLKKEVEIVIIECDKLQQKYKRRDEILDKLFDGRVGNGLENHLEQQLNWLMEQKHYVDQVFYAWKRAETLTSQTCEQFASALELLKRLSRVDDEDQRNEVSKSIAQLLIKSRQDMEQAQRYNPNVDAPFFTDTETERFHKIIETISQPQTISQSDYSQIATVIQFAYKRAVSIRLWLEQILQITIARDSFELAEEYKWIAIQLRKERITLINSKLQEPPYAALAQSIKEKVSKQIHTNESSTISGAGKNEINRDSGVESDDIDIEEEIYRLLEMNKSRLEAAIAVQQSNPTGDKPSSEIYVVPKASAIRSADSLNRKQRDELMRERVSRRVRDQQSVSSSQEPALSMMHDRDSFKSVAQMTNTSTPSKLRVELDETTRQNLFSKPRPSLDCKRAITDLIWRVRLRTSDNGTPTRSSEQVNQIHARHRSKMESLRGDTKAKANNFISNRMQQARSSNADNN